MRIRTAGTIIALMLAIFPLAAWGQGKADEAGTPRQAGPAVTFVTRPNLSPIAEALPHLAGESAQIAAINADLDRIDALDAANLDECERGGGTWNRSVQMPMTGPGYVTFRVAQDYDCGGPYPATSQTVLTYDLTTGRRVDWSAAIPALGLVADSLDGLPDGYVVTVQSAALAAWYGPRVLASPEGEWIEDCRYIFDADVLMGQGFKIWADAEKGGVSVSPDFPHAHQACAETATMTMAELQGFNADPTLVEAIAAAHAGRNWATDNEDEAPLAE